MVKPKQVHSILETSPKPIPHGRSSHLDCRMFRIGIERVLNAQFDYLSDLAVSFLELELELKLSCSKRQCAFVLHYLYTNLPSRYLLKHTLLNTNRCQYIDKSWSFSWSVYVETYETTYMKAQLSKGNIKVKTCDQLWITSSPFLTWCSDI